MTDGGKHRRQKDVRESTESERQEANTCATQAIDESLSSLPVYLAGCRELLVLAGETYTRRLWCVMEMLVFLRMGGSADRVTVLPVPTRSDARSSNAFETMLRRTASLFEAFDAREASCFTATTGPSCEHPSPHNRSRAQASCFHPEDRQRLLGVMEAGFGSLPVFNTVVRRIFAGAADRLDRDQSSGCELHTSGCEQAPSTGSTATSPLAVNFTPLAVNRRRRPARPRPVLARLALGRGTLRAGLFRDRLWRPEQPPRPLAPLVACLASLAEERARPVAEERRRARPVEAQRGRDVLRPHNHAHRGG